MFHGNFWCNIEMNMKTGKLEEHESRIRTPEMLYQMTEPEWMFDNLIDDLALQMYLYEKGHIIDIDKKEMQRLAGYLNTDFNPNAEDMRQEIRQLLHKYAYTATKYILKKSQEFARDNNKKLMIILFDIPAPCQGIPATQQGTHVVISPDIQHEVLSTFFRTFFPEHPAIGLVHTESSHAIIPDRFTQVPCQVLLPGFCIADLVALCKAVPVGIDPARLVCINKGGAGTILSDRGYGFASIYTIMRRVVAKDVAYIRIKLSPGGLIQEYIYLLFRGSSIP